MTAPSEKFPDPLTMTWYAVEDDTIGGYAIALENKPISMGPLYIASFMDREHAAHIADLHNYWLTIGGYE